MPCLDCWWAPTRIMYSPFPLPLSFAERKGKRTGCGEVVDCLRVVAFGGQPAVINCVTSSPFSAFPHAYRGCWI